MKLQTRALSIVHKFFPDVTSVRDATKDAMIDLTARDARASGQKKHAACALAVACKRKYHLTGAIVSVSRAYLIRGQRATRYELPKSIEREIVSFDRGGGFAPGEYRLLKVARYHVQKPKKGHGGKHTGTRPKPRHITSGIRTSLAS